MFRFLISLLLLLPVLLFSQGEVFVLCYHTFLDKKKVDTDISPAEFERHINEIESIGYRFVSMEDIYLNRVYGKKNVLLTIDDGNHSVKNIYESVLIKKGIKPVLFISPAIIGKVKYALKTDDLKYYQDCGATLGSHGYYHMYVNEKLYNDDRATFNREIYHSKKWLDQVSGRETRIYAYPFGVFSPVTKEHLIKAGFRASFSLRRGYMKVPIYMNDDLFDLPRWMVTKRSWPEIINKLKRDAGRFPENNMASQKIKNTLSADKDSKNRKQKIQK